MVVIKDNMMDALTDLPENKIIVDNFIKAWAYVNRPTINKIACTISGGSDSDIMMDIIYRCDIHKKVTYIFFNTGLEYEATKQHLDDLELKYGITILRYRPKNPVPVAVKKTGQPFISKNVSEFIHRLQINKFKWEDEPFDILYERYPHCKSALKWWCDMKGKGSMFGISRNLYLKDFMVENPPTFEISNRCCTLAKKSLIHEISTSKEYDMIIYGVRKAEGGVRSAAYKSCFDDAPDGGTMNYRPIFWYHDIDKKEYENKLQIYHSKCYTKYGLKRTGCAGCPFGRNFEQELAIMEEYEPKLAIAANAIFENSYTYTRAYKNFIKKKQEEKILNS